MELRGLELTGETYYQVFLDPSKVENSIIDFDLDNLSAALGKSLHLSEVITNRVHDHFIDTSRAIKRCFGNKYEHDFQQYNWGLSLIADGKVFFHYCLILF